jgi:hypothetical protein
MTLPAIVVDQPGPNTLVHSPLQVRGSADVFEAVLHLELRGRAGQVLASARVQASAGTGTRGSYRATLTFSVPGQEPATLVAFNLSAKDGTRQHVTTVPLQLAP